MLDDGSRYEPKRFNEDVLVHLPVQVTPHTQRSVNLTSKKDFRFGRSGAASRSSAASSITPRSNGCTQGALGFVGSPPRRLRPKSIVEHSPPTTTAPDRSAASSSTDLRVSMKSGASMLRLSRQVPSSCGPREVPSQATDPSPRLTLPLKGVPSGASASDDQALAALHSNAREVRQAERENHSSDFSHADMWSALFRSISQSLQNCLRFVDKLEAHLRTTQKHAAHGASQPPQRFHNSLRTIATTRVDIRGLQSCFANEGELSRFGASVMQREDSLTDTLKVQLLLFALTQAVALLNAATTDLMTIVHEVGNETLTRDGAHVMSVDCERQLQALQERLVDKTERGQSITRNSFEQQKVLLLQSHLPSFAAWETSHRQLQAPCLATPQLTRDNSLPDNRPQTARLPKKDVCEGPRPPTPRVAGSGGFQHCRPRSAKSSTDTRVPVQPTLDETTPMSKSAAVASVVECMLTDEVRFQRAVVSQSASVSSAIAAVMSKGIEAHAAELSRGAATSRDMTVAEAAESILSDIPWPLASLRHLAHIATSTPHITRILTESIDGLNEAFVKLRKNDGEGKQSAPRTVREWLVLLQRRWHPDVVQNGVERALTNARLNGPASEVEEELITELKDCATKHSTFLAQVINRLKDMSHA